MKARIKATGEIAEFVTGKNLHGEIILQKIGTASIFSLNEVEPMPDVDWQHYRIQAAIAAMQGQLANDESVKQMIEILDNVELPDKTKAYMNLVARSSIMLADALVEELKKGGEE